MEELTRIREELGLTQQRLADESGVNKATINQIERGRRSPNIDTLMKLADAMDREIGEFFPKAQASLPFETGSEQRRAPHLVAWTEYINELATDLEEWSFGFHKGDDPAELPEHEFLAFVGGVSVAGETYRKAKRIIEPLALQHQDEDLARAWRRLSRVILAMATPDVERRLGQMEPGALPDNVVDLKARVA
jgi:transcriptional regulator with XRE-family HTH domain